MVPSPDSGLHAGGASSHTRHCSVRLAPIAEDLKFQNWPGFIKFALGENVKQSNWGDNFRTRYPQTRMGVEQTYVDYLARAGEYGKLKKSGKPYRKDLELEALLEILESKRFITCHSYVQSEITMLMRVAERFGFRVNTFTHILEGYKVADKMAPKKRGWTACCTSTARKTPKCRNGCGRNARVSFGKCRPRPKARSAAGLRGNDSTITAIPMETRDERPGVNGT